MCNGWKTNCSICEKEFFNSELIDKGDGCLVCISCLKKDTKNKIEIIDGIVDKTISKTLFVNKLSEAFAIGGLADKLEYITRYTEEFIEITINGICHKLIDITGNNFEQIVIDLIYELKE